MAKLQIHEQLEKAHAELKKLLGADFQGHIHLARNSLYLRGKVPKKKFEAAMKKINAPNVTFDALKLKKNLEEGFDFEDATVSPDELRLFAHADALSDHLNEKGIPAHNIVATDDFNQIHIDIPLAIDLPKNELDQLKELDELRAKIAKARLTLIKKTPHAQKALDLLVEKQIQQFGGFPETNIRIEKTNDGQTVLVQPIRNTSTQKGVEAIATLFQHLEDHRKTGEVSAKLELTPDATAQILTRTNTLREDEAQDELSNPTFRIISTYLADQPHESKQAVYYKVLKPHIQTFELLHPLPKKHEKAAHELPELQQRANELKQKLSHLLLPAENIA